MIHDAEPQRLLARAREAALQHVSERAQELGVFRSLVCWPEKTSEEFSPDELLERVACALGPEQMSVFTFLRYYDHAKWQPGLGAVVMASEQRDWYLPRFVYWALTPRLFLYQQSQQPVYAGVGLSAVETARYSADAVDCVGRLYYAFGVVGNVRLELSILSVPGAERSPALEPRWRAAHPPNTWISEGEALAESCARSLLAQAGTSPDDLNGPVSRALHAEFSSLRERRALAT